MKKKVLFSIVAVALFAVAMAFNSQNNKNEDLTVKNQEALAQVIPEGFPTLYAASCSGQGTCYVPGAEEFEWETQWVIIWN